MKKIVFILGAFAVLTSACNKSDMPAPQRTCTPCPEDDKSTDLSNRKPARYINPERRFGDTVRIKGPAQSEPAKMPVNVQIR